MGFQSGWKRSWPAGGQHQHPGDMLVTAYTNVNWVTALCLNHSTTRNRLGILHRSRVHRPKLHQRCSSSMPETRYTGHRVQPQLASSSSPSPKESEIQEPEEVENITNIERVTDRVESAVDGSLKRSFIHAISRSGRSQTPRSAYRKHSSGLSC